VYRNTRKIEISRIILPVRVYSTLGTLNCVLLAYGPNSTEVDRWSGAEWLLKVDIWALLRECRNTAEARCHVIMCCCCCCFLTRETLFLFNPIRPVCSFAYRQVKRPNIPRSAHTAVFICFVWISEQTAIISLYNIN